MKLGQVVLFLIEKGPPDGRSVAQLSEAVYGETMWRYREGAVRVVCTMLMRQRLVERRGNGVKGQPYRFCPKQRD